MTSTHSGGMNIVEMLGYAVGGVIVLALIGVLFARMLGWDGGEIVITQQLVNETAQQRIAPIGKVRLAAAQSEAAAGDTVAGTESAAAAPAAAEPVAAAPSKTGEELVQGACAACHIAGVANAPKIGDTDAWVERGKAGLAALVASVTDGKGAMPPRGGTGYSDQEIELAVKEMSGL